MGTTGATRVWHAEHKGKGRGGEPGQVLQGLQAGLDVILRSCVKTQLSTTGVGVGGKLRSKPGDSMLLVLMAESLS